MKHIISKLAAAALLLPGEEYAHEITYSFAMND